ncbi:cell division protein FtsB [Candidatus Pandoraea novymonadis]|uniref:Cell division protein FtsB n=1 Tax=Candidatus Pandoraea novymonadis TaxID=1808959 RepID=A0ABX5FET2_9BURK|nr:cell division protein FtsB [Candidatus Pandoraea novymonadis]PSB92214.1 Cell division protein FtsB [Candidatus Pandoraea novymonadis]
MRTVTLALVLLLTTIQYPLWFGHGGWLHVRELRGQLVAEQKKNEQLKERSDRLRGEVQDLQDGTSAIEEHARLELGMVKQGEVFVQFVAPGEPDFSERNTVKAASTLSSNKQHALSEFISPP